jgi:predicted HTH domain antitoxin
VNGEVDLMQQVVIELPDDVARQVGSYRDRLKELVLLGLFQLKAQEALAMYTRGIVSFGRATEIAGLSHSEMVRQARAVGIKPRWSEQMVEEELT